ncbi:MULTISPECIES: phosphotransferase [unclassified Clostridium]|uniref:phosphotransferase enzyme family protein n=1 Tax=unclassified Clostridium TaxID=2614128 RepID=UPI0002974DC6|nr:MULTISPECIES: phosphotransferase [unclassified Clostridium]EKQ57192.1 MAG: putative homoserine kinase type II (protein kinase fold) [Clostridium sp. Maddingley MBC34-26]
MNGLLAEALSNYEILQPEIEFIRHNENETYKITDKLLNKKYVARIHKSSRDFSLDIFGENKHNIDFLSGEINILKAIRVSTEIPAQIPVKNRYGNYVTILRDGTPVTLLTWINGITIDKIELTYEILFKLGKMIGRFHNFSKNFSEVSNLKRCSYDKIFLKKMSFKLIEGVELKVLSSEQFKIIENAINQINYFIDELNYEKNLKVLVHSDLAKSNLIVTENREVVPIDFGLSGYSSCYMDLGSLFSHFNDEKQQRCIIMGYKSVIHEPIQAKYIEAFMVFQIILFICTHIENAHKVDYFHNAINRWSKEFFIPFVNKKRIIFDF